MASLPFTASSASSLTQDGVERIHFGGCGYLGLGHHPRVREALALALGRYGVSVAASRETSGNAREHELCEEEVAAALGVEAALLCPSGSLANLALAEAFQGDVRLALLDERAHPSLFGAARAAGMETAVYPHLDAARAGEIAAPNASRGVAILTDGVFPGLGTVAPLPELLRALPERGILCVDDAHGFGVLGERGRGSLERHGVSDRRVAITLSLSKALSCHGGAIAGSRELVERVRERSPLWRTSTPIPPALAAAARAALRLLAEEPQIRATLARNSTRVASTLAELGIAVPVEPLPVFAFALDPPERMAALHEELRSQGLLVPLVDYPGGPARDSGPWFRLAVSAAHTEDQVERLCDALERALAKVRAP
ncbi:MAG TPA: pyridoxal phosphate-dependent aminotransferase family protein [Planctomycetota bacterium]|nr:pyridoxal phosphate-dependent aminotransferase family protein [Planctomycetota bacterium]